MSLSARLGSIVTGTTDAQTLAVTRMLVAAAALLKGFAIGGPLLRLTEPDWLRLPVVSWFPYPTAPVATGLLVVWLVAAIGLLLGWRTRVCGGVLAVCLTVPLLLDEQLYSNHLYLVALLTFLLTVADGGAQWSLDARRRGSRNQVPAWPVLLVQAMLPIVYGFAALAKINLVWLSGGVMAASLRTDGLLAVPGSLRTVYVMAAVAVASVLLEGFLAVAFLRPRWRRAGVVLGVAFHISVVATMAATLELVIFALAMFAIYPLFFGATLLPSVCPRYARWGAGAVTPRTDLSGSGTTRRPWPPAARDDQPGSRRAVDAATSADQPFRLAADPTGDPGPAGAPGRTRNR